MSRAFAAFGAGIACLCGVLITYTTLRPELERQKDEREGIFRTNHQNDDTAISRAMMSDLKDAKQQVKYAEKGSFAWGIRQAIWGKPPEERSDKKDDSKSDPR